MEANAKADEIAARNLLALGIMALGPTHADAINRARAFLEFIDLIDRAKKRKWKGRPRLVGVARRGKATPLGLQMAGEVVATVGRAEVEAAFARLLRH